jgi:hypothetical protein
MFTFFQQSFLEIPWDIDMSFSLNITIISPYDLRSYPVLKKPAKVEETRAFCCFCCKSDPILIKLLLPKLGFIPGEILAFQAIIDNRS